MGLQHPPWRLLQGHPVHRQVGGHPGHLGLPGQHHQAGRIGNRQHIRVGRCHRQPGGKTGEARPVFGKVGGGGDGHELGPLHAEQIRERKQEMANAMGGSKADQIVHGNSLRGEGELEGESALDWVWTRGSARLALGGGMGVKQVR